VKLVKASGLTKHGELVAMLKATLGMGHGDANTIVHLANKSAAVFSGASGTLTLTATSGTPGPDAEVDRIYTGPKAALRPIHDAVMAGIGAFGDFEIAPKKTYLSLRRKKQFATLGPATNMRVEVGLNMKGVAATGRLEALPPGGMCQYRIKLIDAAGVNAELLAWIRRAFDESA